MSRWLLSIVNADEADDIRERAEEILSRSQFQEPEPSPLERLLDWIARGLDRVLGPIFELFGIGGVGNGVAGLVLIVLTAVVVYVLVKAFLNWKAGSVAADDQVVDIDKRSRLSAERWRQLAAEHEAAREWDLAVRCHYRAAMAELADSRKITDLPGATTGDWEREAIANSVSERPVEALTDVFDGVWYGETGAGSREVEVARSAGEAVVSRGGDGE